MKLNNDVSNDPVEEYKSYVSNALRSTFDYNTWYQHQYGVNPSTSVDSILTFMVSSGKESHK